MDKERHMGEFKKGKYAGMSYAEVASKDIEYMSWCLSLNIDTKDKLDIWEAMRASDIKSELPF